MCALLCLCNRQESDSAVCARQVSDSTVCVQGRCTRQVSDSSVYEHPVDVLTLLRMCTRQMSDSTVCVQAGLPGRCLTEWGAGHTGADWNRINMGGILSVLVSLVRPLKGRRASKSCTYQRDGKTGAHCHQEQEREDTAHGKY